MATKGHKDQSRSYDAKSSYLTFSRVGQRFYHHPIITTHRSACLSRSPTHVHTVETGLTSPKHIDDQPDLAPLTRCKIIVIRLDGRSVSEQEVVADDQGLRARVAFW